MFSMKLGPARKIITWGLYFALAFILFFIWYTYQNVKKEEEESLHIAEALEVLHLTEDFIDDIQDLESSQRSYLISGDSAFLQSYENALASLSVDTSRIRSFLNEYPAQRESFSKLMTLVKEKLSIVEKSVRIRSEQGMNEAAQKNIIGQGRLLIDSIRALATGIENKNRILLRESNKGQEAAAKKGDRLFIVLAFLFVLSMVALLLRMGYISRKEQLQEKRIEYLARLVQSSGDAIFSSDPHFNIISWNRAAEELYGYSEQEAVGRHFLELLKSRSDEEKRKEVVQSVIQTGSYKGEFEYTTKDGRDIIIHSSVSIIKDDNDKVKGFVIVHRDITQKKQMELQLKQFNDQLEKQVIEKSAVISEVFQRVSDAIIAVDRNWNYTYINSKAEELLGKDPGYLIGRHIWTEFPEMVNEPFYKEYIAAMETQTYRWVETYYPARDKWFENHIYPSHTGLSIYFKDISERKKAETSLRQAINRFDMVAKATNDIVWEASLDDNNIWWNDNFFDKFGYSRNEMYNSVDAWEKLIHPEDKEEAAGSFKAAIEDPAVNTWTKEYRFRKSDGSYSYIYDRCYILRHDDGRANRAVGSMTDITELVLTNEKLKITEDRYRLMVEEASDAIFINDKNGQLLEVNNRACELLGYTSNQLCSMNVADLMPDEELMEKPVMYKELLSGERTHVERNMKRRDASLVAVDITARLLSDGRIIAIVRDVSEQKKAKEQLEASEKLLRHALSGSAESFYVINRDCRIILINKIAQSNLTKAWGHPVDIGSNILELFREDDNEPVKESLEKVFSGQRVEYELQLAIENLPEWVRVSYMPVTDDENNITGAFISTTDISAKKKSDEVIRRSEEKARLLTRSALDAIITIDAAGNVISWNPQAEKIFGWLESEITGKRLSAFIIPHRYRDAHDKGMARFMETGEGPVLNNILELPAVNRTGNEFPVEISIIPIKQSGVLTFTAFIRDISVRKKAEAELRKFNERFEVISSVTHDAIWEWHLETNELWANEVHQQLYGLGKEEPVPGVEEWSSRIHPEDREKTVSAQTMALTSDTLYWETEYRFRKPDGNYVFLFDRCYIIRNEEGKPVRMTGSMIDITERKKAEEEIRERAVQLYTLSNSLPGMMTYQLVRETSGEMKFVYISESVESLMGYPVKEVIANAQLLYELIHPDDLLRVKEAEEVSYRNMTVFEVEIRSNTKTRGMCWFYIRSVPRKMPDGSVKWDGVHMDITERKKAEEEIVKARNMAEKLIDTLPGVFYFYDKNGKFLRWNKQFELVTGYSGEEISRMRPIDFYHEDTKAYIAEQIRGVFDKGVNDAEADFFTKEGKRIPYYFKAVLLEYEGKPCLLGSGIDISERKRAEEELRRSEKKYKLLFQNNPMPMWMLSLPDLNVVDVNEAALKHYGYTRSQFLKLNAREMRPAEDVHRFEEVAVKQKKGIRYSGAWRHLKKDGTIIHVEVIAHDIEYDEKPVRLILANDITEKLLADELLKKSLEDIRRLTEHVQRIREEERAHIAREIHDELGQQLTVLKMDVSWLNKKLGNKDESVKERLTELANMLDGTVKTVRRISSELRPSILDDLGLIAAIEWHLREFEKRIGIIAEFDELAEENFIPEAIKTGVFRIFQESLTNVARHAAASRVKVTLNVKKDNLVLTIEDNGKGFNIEKAKDKKTLGILGMRERTAMLGGSYEINSEPGKGTVVIVSVPLSVADLQKK